jgi:putative nucleotide binding protein
LHLQKQKKYEDYAYVLDVIDATLLRSSARRVNIHRGELLVQLLGEEYFTLLEAAINENYRPRVGIRFYIGKDVPRNILRILGRIGYDELTENAKIELENAIQKIVQSNEKKFVEFFNTCTPVSPRLHALELIPGIGKKSMQKILEEREKKPFESFKDLHERGGIPDPVKAITKRIMDELTGRSGGYFLLVREPSSFTSERSFRKE